MARCSPPPPPPLPVDCPPSPKRWGGVVHNRGFRGGGGMGFPRKSLGISGGSQAQPDGPTGNDQPTDPWWEPTFSTCVHSPPPPPAPHTLARSACMVPTPPTHTHTHLIQWRLIPWAMALSHDCGQSPSTSDTKGKWLEVGRTMGTIWDPNPPGHFLDFLMSPNFMRLAACEACWHLQGSGRPGGEYPAIFPSYWRCAHTPDRHKRLGSTSMSHKAWVLHGTNQPWWIQDL